MSGRLWLIYLCVCVIAFMDVQSQTCYERCEQIRNICPQDSSTVMNEIEGISPTFECQGSLSRITMYQSPNGTIMPIMTNDRYVFTDNTLRITDLQATDEGLYECNDGVSTTFCLTVVEMATFATCEQPENEIMCTGEEIVNVTAGDNAVFNTKLVFSGTSVCKCYQQLSTFRFTSEDPNITASFSCSSPCNDNDSTITGNLNRTQSMSNDQPFNFELVLPSVSLDYNGSTFGLSAFGSRPDGGTDRFTKRFTLIVNMAPPTTTPESTTQPPDNSLARALGGAIAGIFLALLIVVVISVVVCVLYQRFVNKRFKLSKEPAPVDPEYAEITDIEDSGKFMNRNSQAYSSTRGPPNPGNVDLTDTLESAAAVF